MNAIQQVFAITWMNLRNIPSRLGASLVIVVGIAGVVAVLVAILAMARGFEATLKNTGAADRAIVMRGGSDTEMSSGLSNTQARVIATKPGIARNEEGTVLAASEIYVIADIRKRANNSEANLPIRGVDPVSFLVRDEIKIKAGRQLEFGKYELLAGYKAADQFQGLDVGNRIKLRGAEWEVVGLFESGGTVHESEVWVDTVLLADNLNRSGAISSMVVKLESPLEFDVLKQALDDDPQLETNLLREATYYGEQSTGTTQLINTFGYGVAIIMAIGAVFGALNTMYAAVSSRSVEIATLRALGFGPAPVVISVMTEALVLALIGGMVGGGLAYVFFNGYTASTMGATFSQVSFSFAVTEELLTRGILWSCGLGLIGGLLPSISAARQPITIALRGL